MRDKPAKLRTGETPLAPRRRSGRLAAAAVLYVAVVLGIDALATMGATWPIAWSWFDWRSRDVYGLLRPLPEFLTFWLKLPVLREFDWFKFLLWFVVPFLLCLRRLDWGAVGFTRWKRRDYFVLGLLIPAGIGVMALTRIVPELAEIYPSHRALPNAAKFELLLHNVVWLVSWLIGWEFLHRYFLLNPVHYQWPRYGWLLVPLAEGLYHLQKPDLELVGMVVFSVILTRWTLRRRNVLLPFFAHLIVEIDLVLFQLLI